MLTHIELSGFKSIFHLALPLKRLNVLIGPNGAGKSNLLDFFRLLMAARDRRFQKYVADAGSANSLMFYGSRLFQSISANEITAKLVFDTEQGTGTYRFTLTKVPVDSLAFIEEVLEYPSPPYKKTYSNGGQGSRFFSKTIPRTRTGLSDEIRYEIGRYGFFQFDNTDNTAPIRGRCDLNQNRFLLPDGANLAAVLYRLREKQSDFYTRIVKMIRLIAPFFDDFVLEPLALNERYIELRWRACHSDYEFGPHQLSDGSLRTIALFTLLLQPETDLPSLIILDEPELGLHPYAISLLAGLLRATSVHTQVMLATQSVNLLNEFAPADVVVVEQQQGQSIFKRLEESELDEWLGDYSLGELWNMNVFGGRPTR